MPDTFDLNRRKFMGQLSGLLAATAVPSTLSLTADAAEATEILGQGGFRYRVVPGWGVLDKETPVKDCHGMVQSRDGRVYLLTNHTANNVIIYDKAGKLQGKWGKAWPGAHGLTLFNESGEERFFVTDHDRHQVFKTTLDGKILATYDWPEASGKYAKADQYKPTHVAPGNDGTFYVADGYGLNYIMHYDAAGKLIRTFGGGADGPAALKCAHGIHVDRREPNKPVLLITSRSQSAIKRFTLDGEYLDTIAMPGAQPCFMIPFGEHLIVPHLMGGKNPEGSKDKNGFVSVLDRNNRIVSNVAADAPAYDAEGKLAAMSANRTLFRYPHGLMVDDEQSIYVAQWNSGQTYPIKLQRV